MKNKLKNYLNKDDKIIEAGCDEAGRGALCGPVVSACVIMPRNIYIKDLQDSKKLTAKKRYSLRYEIEKIAIDFAIAFFSEREILENNILNTSIMSMHRCIDNLTTLPKLILVDGNRFKPYNNIPHKCIIKGDSKFSSIAAASILAKTYRDDYMNILDRKYPKYMWSKNKGYPTKEHIKSINMFGKTKYHRKNFNINKQLKLM